MDNVKLALAVVCVFAGVAAYYYYSDLAVVLRVLMVLAGLAMGAFVGWLSQPGKEFYVFAQEAWAESGRVSWPSRKETLQTTGIVFLFVLVMALFLFAVDASLAWIVKLMTGRADQ